MPIGNQKIGDIELSESQLRKKYDYIIKNAIQRADPSLEVIRADDELNSGSISNDIFTKLMHSKYVIADITYPNPNVFYELGIRHAISPRTILIREKINFSVPFDISHLRYVPYTQEADGMENLTNELKKRFTYYNQNPTKPDNQFLELCSFTNYIPTFYGKSETTGDIVANLLTSIFTNPQMRTALTDKSLSKEEQQSVMLQEFSKDPDNTKQIIKALFDSDLMDE